MSHPYPEEYGVVLIPADTDLPIEYKLVGNSLENLKRLIGGGWLEVVRTEYMPKMACGCRTVMVVDEEGRLKGLPRNPRAEVLYPFAPIAGDAFLIGEGYVKAKDSGEDAEPDFVPLGPEWHNWEGPGAPSPGVNDEYYQRAFELHRS